MKKIKVLCFIALTLLLFSCTKKQSQKTLEEQKISEEEKKERTILAAKENAISEYVASLSDETRISQLFLVNVEGNQNFHSVEKTSLETPLVPGGALLFSYNISKDPLETYEYIKSIHDFYVENQNVPPYIAVDQEGGEVNRLRSLTSVLWSQKKVAENFSESGAALLYSSQAKQMKNLGFNLNLAPVVEVENEANKDFLDTRTFGSRQDTLCFGKIAVTSYESNKIGTVLKHFPGNSSTDPHTGLPEIIVTKASLEENYLAPFKNLLPLSSAVLMSHARVTIPDDETYSESKTPACLSKFWVTEVLKNRLGFSGLVISDDIFMGALSKNGFPPESAAVKAIEAGIDVIMLSEKKFGNMAALLLKKEKEDENFSELLNDAVKNVIRYKIKAGILEFSETSHDESGNPRFSVQIAQKYEEFDLFRFNEDYKEGMKAFES